MLKKTITYKNLDGEEVTEEFHFHLSKAQLTEMALSEEDLAGRLKAVAEGTDKKQIIETFKWIIEISIGQRSEDGKRFVRDATYANEFMQSEAFGELFVELFTDANAAAQFIVGVVPSDLSDKLAVKASEMFPVAELPAEPADVAATFDDFSDDQLLAMNDEEFNQLRKKIKGNNIPRRVLIIDRMRQQNR